MESGPLLSIVDDDDSMRDSLVELLRSTGFRVNAFASAEEFLASDYLDDTGCLILDVSMPAMSGPELQQKLGEQGRGIPIVFITARGDERVRSLVLERGATAFLVKPFGRDDLLDAVRSAQKEHSR